MADTQVTWRGLTLGGGDSPFHIEEITGWDDLPELITTGAPRARAHGSHVGSRFARSRIVTIAGSIADRAARDELATTLMADTPVQSDVLDLTVETFGRRLTAGAQLVRRSLPVGENYASGKVPFALQWECPDPLRYGPAQPTYSVGLPVATGGLDYPLTYPMDYGFAGDTGQIALFNGGTADASILMRVTGPIPQGFAISAGEQLLVYPLEVPAGQTIDIDTATGSVLIEGTAERRAALAWADFMQVPAGQTLILQFASLGGATDPAARLEVLGFREAHW